MNEALSTALADLLARLESRVEQARWPAPEAGFAAHVMGTSAAFASDRAVKLAAQLRDQASREMKATRWSEAPVLAAAGYVIGDGAVGNGFVDCWREGVGRLAERDPFPPDRASFFYRPVELYGLARGARATGGPFATWLSGVVADGEQRASAEIWQRTLGAVAANVLERPWALSLPAAELGAARIDEIALLAWLVDVQPETAASLLGERATRPDFDRTLLRSALLEHIDVPDAARAAVIAVSLHAAVNDVLESAHAMRWQLSRSERDASDVVVHLCRRFPRYVRQLAARHADRTELQIADEYDLQDHLHALLRLHFDDVRPEEWAPSYAGSRSRMDFLLKRERTVVETKMTRERLDQRKVVEELIVDKDHYRQHPECKTLVCFVYDPNHRLTNPDALEGDVSEKSGDLIVHVVVAPRTS